MLGLSTTKGSILCIARSSFILPRAFSEKGNDLLEPTEMYQDVPMSSHLQGSEDSAPLPDCASKIESEENALKLIFKEIHCGTDRGPACEADSEKSEDLDHYGVEVLTDASTTAAPRKRKLASRDMDVAINRQQLMVVLLVASGESELTTPPCLVITESIPSPILDSEGLWRKPRVTGAAQAAMDDEAV